MNSPALYSSEEEYNSKCVTAFPPAVKAGMETITASSKSGMLIVPVTSSCPLKKLTFT